MDYTYSCDSNLVINEYNIASFGVSIIRSKSHIDILMENLNQKCPIA